MPKNPEYSIIHMKKPISTKTNTNTNIPQSVKIRLRRMGLSELGINQLSLRQIISDPKDREIVSQIVANSLAV